MKRKKTLIVIAIAIIICIATLLLFFTNSFAYFIDGEKSNSIPSKSFNYVVDVNCKNADGLWDYNNWEPVIKNIKGDVSCDIEFNTSSSHETLANLIISKTGEGNYDSTLGLYKWQITNETVAGKSIGYRYVGDNPDNYVLFNNEYWRIVGVMNDNSHGISGKNLVKIVREDEIPDYNTHLGKLVAYFTASDNYSTRGLLNEYDKSMIVNAKWSMSACEYYNNLNLTYIYSNCDIVTPDYNESYIGLLYLSDYYFAFPEYIQSRSSNINSLSNPMGINGADFNWLTHNSSIYYAFNDPDETNIYGSIYSLKKNNNGISLATDTIDVNMRPAVYLDEKVFARIGTGTKDDPYILEINK